MKTMSAEIAALLLFVFDRFRRLTSQVDVPKYYTSNAISGITSSKAPNRGTILKRHPLLLNVVDGNPKHVTHHPRFGDVLSDLLLHITPIATLKKHDRSKRDAHLRSSEDTASDHLINDSLDINSHIHCHFQGCSCKELLQQ